MNFTREPIIETVITPREGCKLVVRSSKGASQEDYFVDAVEVVSFGHSFFFRSLERPKSFLVPVSDYEILELKETRMVLKNASVERSIKIGGGREAPMRPTREAPSAEPMPEEAASSTDRPAERPPERSMDRKRDKRRSRRRGGRDRGPESYPQQGEPMERSSEEAPMETSDIPLEAAPAVEAPKAPSFISKLFPPPTTLIKETLSRYKPAEPSEPEAQVSFEEKTSFEESIFEHPASDSEDDLEQ